MTEQRNETAMAIATEPSPEPALKSIHDAFELAASRAREKADIARQRAERDQAMYLGILSRGPDALCAMDVDNLASLIDRGVTSKQQVEDDLKTLRRHRDLLALLRRPHHVNRLHEVRAIERENPRLAALFGRVAPTDSQI